VTAEHDTELFERACRVIPGGVSSPVRAWGPVGGTPRFLRSASGAWVTDESGRRLVDLIGSWGPAILGHTHPEVVAAVREAAGRALSFGAPTAAEVDLAELICARVAPVEQVRFVSTGTEATMTAIRLARAATGRDLLVKFAGCYHGHSDSLLVAAGSGLATAGRPSSAGVPDAIAALTLVVPYNDVDALEALFAERGDQIAAVITEPAPANMGVIVPDAGFNAAIRRITAAHGALMIADEVLTGFRCSFTGEWGREQQAGESWVPDLFTFGKVVGGGMPLAALGGPRDLMELLAPVGPVYQAGTLSGNPLATAAGIATLSRVDEALMTTIDRVADSVTDSAHRALDAAGVPHRVQRVGSLFSIFFGESAGERPVRDFTDAQAQDLAAHKAFFHAVDDAGVLLPPSAFEAWFVSAAHDDQALEVIDRAMRAGAEAAARVVG